jgi:hypothetical protein
MSRQNAPLGQQCHEISKAELEPRISADAEDDDLPIETPTLEKIIHAKCPVRLLKR